MNKLIIFSQLFRIMFAVLIIGSAGSAYAAAKTGQGDRALLDAYHRNMSRLALKGSGPPLFVESFEGDGSEHVDIYGIFDYPFKTVAAVLKKPANWCDIVSLHPNVKACTYSDPGSGSRLGFYLGRKSYQSTENLLPVVSSFRNTEHPGYLDIHLDAVEGPYGTRNHRMRFEAIPLPGGRTFVHVSYAYSDSAALRLAAKIYFATLGRGKVGFTVTGTDGNGKPDYIGGPRGALERSAVRYYFAIQSFMNTQHYPEVNRFSMRISQWHDLTSRYRRQLFDQDKDGYLALKSREHNNQIMLQRQILEGHP